jgi:hypothetical protein
MASKSLARRLRPILSDVIPKKESLIKELTAPMHMNTIHCKMLLITSYWEPDFIALMALPMKFGKKKSVILPRNIKGKPIPITHHCSAKKPSNSLFY